MNDQLLDCFRDIPSQNFMIAFVRSQQKHLEKIFAQEWGSCNIEIYFRGCVATYKFKTKSLDDCTNNGCVLRHAPAVYNGTDYIYDIHDLFSGEFGQILLYKRLEDSLRRFIQKMFLMSEQPTEPSINKLWSDELLEEIIKGLLFVHTSDTSERFWFCMNAIKYTTEEKNLFIPIEISREICELYLCLLQCNFRKSKRKHAIPSRFDALGCSILYPFMYVAHPLGVSNDILLSTEIINVLPTTISELKQMSTYQQNDAVKYAQQKNLRQSMQRDKTHTSRKNIQKTLKKTKYVAQSKK